MVCPFQGPAAWTLDKAKALRMGVGSGWGCSDVQLNRLMGWSVKCGSTSLPPSGDFQVGARLGAGETIETDPTGPVC